MQNVWGLGDVATEPQDLVDKGLTFRSDIQRTGEPFTDAATPSRSVAAFTCYVADACDVVAGQERA